MISVLPFSVIFFSDYIPENCFSLTHQKNEFMIVDVLLFTQLADGNLSEINILNLKCFYFHLDTIGMMLDTGGVQVFAEDIN